MNRSVPVPNAPSWSFCGSVRLSSPSPSSVIVVICLPVLLKMIVFLYVDRRIV